MRSMRNARRHFERTILDLLDAALPAPPKCWPRRKAFQKVEPALAQGAYDEIRVLAPDLGHGLGANYAVDSNAKEFLQMANRAPDP